MNIDNINDLPKKYRGQAEIKLGKMNGSVKLPGQPRPKKYRNQSTIINGIKFDSKKEAARYGVLMEKLKNGDISDLRLQVGFSLIEGFTTITGVRIKPERYVADFTYIDSDGKLVVEDVKSDITRKNPVYRIKKKQMADRHGIIITEV